jgi:hypothetical protein
MELQKGEYIASIMEWWRKVYKASLVEWYSGVLWTGIEESV